MARFRILFMGTPDFSVSTLQALIDGPDEVVGVITRPDKPVGRGKRMSSPPVKSTALAAGIPVLQPTKIKVPAFEAQIRAFEADLAVVIAYGRILPLNILQAPRLGCINVHASILPKLRGAAPINWSIVRGHAETGVSIMQMDVGMDTGDVFLTDTLPILPGECAGDLHDHLSSLGASALMRALEGISDGSLQAPPQDHPQATHAPMMNKKMGRLRWDRSAQDIVNQIHGFNPWPGCSTTLQLANGKQLQLKVHRAKASTHTLTSGEVLAENGQFFIGADIGSVELLEVQAAGKKRASAEAFSRGYQLAGARALAPLEGGLQ